jgi:hypothetical protein
MTWLSQWRDHARHNELERERTRRRRRSFRPTVFDLEDRVTPAVHVTTTLDAVNSKDGVISLREAITIENAGGDSGQLPGPQHTIILDKVGVYKITIFGPGDNLNLSGDFDIATNNLTIQGGAAGTAPGSFIVDGNGPASGDRVFDVNPLTPGAANVVFKGLTIRNGSPLATLGENGGGIRALNINTTVTLDKCILTNNFSRGDTVAAGSTGGSGGGAWVAGTLKAINGTQITFNHTLAGTNTGAGTRVNGDGAGVFSRDIVIDHSTVSDNFTDLSVTTATAARGAGLFGTRQVNVVNNSVITRNRAATNGGGIADSSTSTAFGVNVVNSHVDGNFAGITGVVGSGGGINMLGLGTSSLSMVNSTANTNTALSGGGIAATVTPTTFVNLNNSQANSNKATAGGGGGILSTGFVNLTLGSQVNNNTAAAFGGGIAMTSATGGVTLDDSRVDLNHSFGGPGGGILSGNTVSVLNRSSVSTNTASTAGGGIFTFGAGSVVVTGVAVAGGASMVDNNVAEAGNGGGIDAVGGGGVNLLYADVSGNFASGSGGGINDLFFATSTIDSSLISRNTAGCTGGGLNAFTFAAATLDVMNSTFGENQADVGCMVEDDGGEELAAGPHLDGGGGAAIFVGAGGTVTFLYDTINNNSAGLGGGLLNFGPAPVNLEDTFVVNSTLTGGNFASPFGGGFVSLGNNLSDDPATSGFFVVANGDIVDTKAPLTLGDLEDNGGPTKTYALLPGSPAIDAGDDAIGSQPTLANPNGFDQRGFNRIVGAHSDIGAFELGGLPPPPPPPPGGRRPPGI